MAEEKNRDLKKDPRSSQKREVEVNQLEKEEQFGIAPGVQKVKGSQQNKEKDSEEG